MPVVRILSTQKSTVSSGTRARRARGRAVGGAVVVSLVGSGAVTPPMVPISGGRFLTCTSDLVVDRSTASVGPAEVYVVGLVDEVAALLPVPDEPADERRELFTEDGQVRHRAAVLEHDEVAVDGAVQVAGLLQQSRHATGQARRAAAGAVVDAAGALGERDVVVEVVGQLGEGRTHPLAPCPAARDVSLEREGAGRDGLAQLRPVPADSVEVDREVDGCLDPVAIESPHVDRSRRSEGWNGSIRLDVHGGTSGALNGRPTVPTSSRARDDQDRAAAGPPKFAQAYPLGYAWPMDHIIIGGVAGGMSAATRLRRLDEDAHITVVERSGHVSFANCGLPYHVGGVIADRESLLLQTPASLGRRFGLDVRVGTEAVRIDRERRVVVVRELATGRESEPPCDSVLLSPGARPVRPPI